MNISFMNISRKLMRLFGLLCMCVILQSHAILQTDAFAESPADETVTARALAEEFIHNYWVGIQATVDTEVARAKKIMAPPVPFYQSASEYLQARGAVEQPIIRASYKVETRDATVDLPDIPIDVELLIGPDFVAETRQNATRIYDFKLRRIITLRKSEAGSIFKISSMYHEVLKRVDRVNTLTQNGNVNLIKLGPDTRLSAFWLETALGWSARTEFDTGVVNADAREQSLNVQKDEHEILNIRGKDVKLPSDSHVYSLLAYWHYHVPMHPALFLELPRIEFLPKNIDTFVISPNYPNGQISNWTLESARVQNTDFPLPLSAQNLIQTSDVTPIYYVMQTAAKGLAESTYPDQNDLRDAIAEARLADDSFTAWVLSKELESRIGGCEYDPALLCSDIMDFEADADPDTVFGRIVKAREFSNSSKDQVEALSLYNSVLETQNAPAVVHKFAGQLRARIKSSDISNPELAAIDAEKQLEIALAKSPYDPEIYQTLAQIYAVQGKWEDSWNMYDFMRNLPDSPSALRASINNVEQRLETIAPGFFIP